MLEQISDLVQGTGLEKAIEQIQEEINQGKLVEKEVESVVVSAETVQTYDAFPDERVTKFKKGRKTKYSGYEEYTEQEAEELAERWLLMGIIDALDMTESLSGFCEEYGVSIEFDDDRRITDDGYGDELIQVKTMLSEYMRQDEY